MGVAAYVWDAASDNLVWSPNAAKVIGVEFFADLASGRRFAGLLDPDNPFNRHDAIFGSSARDAGGGVSYELRYALKSDPQAEPRWIEDCERRFAGPDGKPARAAGIVRVVTDRRHESLAARRDAGRTARPRLADRHRRSRPRQPDLRFDLADQVIGMVAQRLCSRIRTSDALARFSGNKFGIVLHECDGDELAIAAARFINAVREGPLETAAGPIAVSVTAGGTLAPRHGRTVADILGHAQEALDRALAAGRGSFRAYVPSVESAARRRENLRQADVIVSALNDRRVTMAFNRSFTPARGSLRSANASCACSIGTAAKSTRCRSCRSPKNSISCA
jgi:hypothetical protein